MDAVECGAASLGMILRYYGLWAPLAEMRRECGVSRDGSKASSIVKAARRYGLNTKAYSKDLNGLKAMKFPVIVFWNFCHFLVVEGVSESEVFLNDPAFGHTAIGFGEFENGFTGVVLAFEPGENFVRRGSPPRALSALFERLRGQFTAVGYCVLAGLLLVIPGIVGPTFSSIFIDNILLEHRTAWARPLLAAMLVTLIIQLLLKLLQLTHLRRLRISLSARMTSRFLWHLLRLPVPYYAQRYPGDIGNRAQLNEEVASVLSGQLATACIDISTMCFFATVMFFYDKTLTAIGVGLAVLNICVLKWVAGRREEANMRLTQESGKSSAVAIATLENIEGVKASGLEREKFSQWAGQFARESNAGTELERSSLAIGILPVFAGSLTTVLILVAGGLRVIDGELTIGELVAFQLLMDSFLQPIDSLVEVGSSIQELQGNLLRLDDVLDNPVADEFSAAAGECPATAATTATPSPEPLSSFPENNPGKIEMNRDDRHEVRLRGELEIRGISFGYSPLETPLISGLDIRLRQGASLALVGGSGSGKSTLAKVICGLYPAGSGEILFDRRSASAIPRQVFVNSVALVDQDVVLFDGTVRENLTLWDRSVSDAAVVRACRDAEIHETILRLPKGYDTMLADGGGGMSGGERQRLEIARVLVRDPSILILDEATSALDSDTERMISDNIRRRGCTCVIIAHRLSTIRDCDEIIVLHAGSVVERGRHSDLWAADGVYARLVKQDGV
jgi:ATP-binding cassette subfamily C protein